MPYEKVICQGQITIYDMHDGSTGYTVLLSKDSYAIQCDHLGYPIPGEIGFSGCKASSKITVMKDDIVFTPIGENSSITNNTFKYKIIANSSCLALRTNNDTFYIKELYSDSGVVDIEITLDNGEKVSKQFSFTKVNKGEDVRYVEILGAENFKYNGKHDTTPTPTTVKLEAKPYNISTYEITWKYYKPQEDVYVDVVNGTGSVVQGNNLTINDKTLFGVYNFAKIKVLCKDKQYNDTFEDEVSILKIYDGEDAKYITLSPSSTQFKYEKGSITPTIENINMKASAYNINSPSFVWQYYNYQSEGYINISGATTDEYTLNHSSNLFQQKDVIDIRVLCSDNGITYSDMVTISKVYDGDDGNPGEPGDPSKVVIISGGSIIHYDKNNVPSPTSILLTAQQSNYVSPKYKWFYKNGVSFAEIVDATSSTYTVNHNSIAFKDNIALFKVECSEQDGTDKTFYEHTISKTYDGEDSSTLVLNVVDGTRNICYNGKGLLMTTIINPFRLELFDGEENVTTSDDVRSITWTSIGHYKYDTVPNGDITFRPIPISNYDEEKLDTNVSVIVNYKGRIIKQTAPVTVSKNSTALDWVEEWDGSKVDIGGDQIITPKLFAGKKDTQRNTITGVAIGQDIINKNDNIGMAIYYDNDLIGRINADPSLDNNKLLAFGKEGKQLILNIDGSVEIQNQVKIGISSVEEITSDIEDAKTNITSTKEQVVNIQADLSGITNRVSSVETTTETIDGKVTSLDTRITSAEEKITDEAITSTVGKYFYSKNDIDAKGYQNESQVQQTVDKWEVKFTESGGYNKVRNYSFYSDFNYWDNWGSCTRQIMEHTNGIKYLHLTLTGQNQGVAQSVTGLTVGRKYTLSAYVQPDLGKIGGIQIHCNGSYFGAKVDVASNKVQKLSVTFTATKENADVQLGNAGFSGSYGIVRIWEVQLEEGEMATPATPHPNEMYDGIASIDRDGVTISMSDGEGVQGKTTVSYDGLTVYDSNNKEIASFGQSSTAFIGELTTNNIWCDNVVKYDKGRPADASGKTYLYVSTSGSGDKTGRDTSNKADSINGALEWYASAYGKVLNRTALNIDVANGSYEENVAINGWSGHFDITVILNSGVTLNGSFSIQNNTLRVYINGKRSSNSANDGAIIKNIGASDTFFTGDGYVSIANLRATSVSTDKNFLMARRGSKVELTCIDVTRHGYFILSYNASHVGLWNNRGKVTRRFACRYGSTIAIDGSQPMDDGGSYKQEGSAILLDNCTPTDSLYNPSGSTTPPTSWQWFEKSFTLTSLKTVPEGSGITTSGKTGEWGQGKWGSYKPHRGYATIPDDLSSWCTGGQNFTATITMTRLNTSHGQTGAVPVPVINGWSSAVAFARGDTKTITLPSSLYNNIVNGTTKTLEMWGGTSTSQYSFYNNTKITIKCQKQI